MAQGQRHRDQCDKLHRRGERKRGEMRPLAGGLMDLDFRYVMRFPSRLDSATVARPKCDSVRAL